MARVVILDDLQEAIAILAPPLAAQGHDLLSDVSPIDFERIMRFRPDVILLNLYRRIEAFDRPIGEIRADIEGFDLLLEMEQYPAIGVIPIILLGNCLQEKDVPTSVNYDLFLSLPRDLKLYLPKVIEIATTVKTRRHISNHVCPRCGSRLTYTGGRQDDLFCPRCHTAVALISPTECLARTSEGNTFRCDMAALTPPHALPEKTED